jgi:DNA-binding MarR family transcriptional regulator
VTAPDLPTLTHRLAHLTRRAMGMRMQQEHWALDVGFRPGCIGVLQTVAALEPVSQREVSDRLLLDPSDLVSLVDILEKAGLVERRRDPADRRRYALEITRAGRTAVRRLELVARDAGEAVLAPLDEAERQLLGHLLQRVVDHHASFTDLGDPTAAGRARRSAGS